MSTIGTAEIVKLLKLYDKNLKGLTDDTKKKYKASIKAQKETIQGMVEGVTTTKEYAAAAQKLASTITEVKAFEKLQASKGEVEYPKPKVAKIDGLKTSNAKGKIDSIWETGPSYKGTPGPKSLGSHMLHAHITNKDAIAYYWKKDQMHVEGYGVKSGQSGAKDSGYKWETK